MSSREKKSLPDSRVNLRERPCEEGDGQLGVPRIGREQELTCRQVRITLICAGLCIMLWTASDLHFVDFQMFPFAKQPRLIPRELQGKEPEQKFPKHGSQERRHRAHYRDGVNLVKVQALAADEFSAVKTVLSSLASVESPLTCRAGLQNVSCAWWKLLTGRRFATKLGP